MKKAAAFIVSMVVSNFAMADGWVCQTEAGDLNIKVYNNTSPELGTRSSAVMVLSDPQIQYGRKTIATFRNAAGTLSQDGARYAAKVDLRFTEISHEGEQILGTKLGYVDQLVLSVGFNYNEPIAHGDLASGSLVLAKRNGQQTLFPVLCSRYLKN